MPRGIEQDIISDRAIKALDYMKNHAPCTTITGIANALNLSWSQARNLMRHLVNSKLVLEIAVRHRILWCINEKAATMEIAALRHATWRLICTSKRKFITPSQLFRLIAKDAEASKIYAKYINVNKIHANALKFLAAVIEDLVGPPIEKTKRKVIFHVPREICEKPPAIDNIPIKRYKQPHNLVTVKLSPTMYMDLVAAANYLNVEIPQLVRIAIARLINQYRHLLRD